MRRAIAALLLIVTLQPAHAETCREKFVGVFTDRTGKGPVKIHVTQTMKGGPTTKNYSYQTGDGDWMTEMIEPANMQWSMARNNVLYSSADKGKTWKMIRALGDAKSPEEVKKDLETTTSTVKNEACGSEELDGVMHETVEADYAMVKFKTEHHEKFWVNSKTGWISKSVMQTQMSGFESSVTQIIEKAPNLTLPSPK